MKLEKQIGVVVVGIVGACAGVGVGVVVVVGIVGVCAGVGVAGASVGVSCRFFLAEKVLEKRT